MNKIPDKINIDGEVNVIDNYLVIDINNETNEISTASIVIELQVKSLLNGVEIVFDSRISHKFNEKELVELLAQMEKDINN